MTIEQANGAVKCVLIVFSIGAVVCVGCAAAWVWDRFTAAQRRRIEVRTARRLAASYTAWHDVFAEETLPYLPVEEAS